MPRLLPRRRPLGREAIFPLWLKIVVTIAYVYISRGTWQQYSAFNFLWFSHIGFMGTVLALWFESRLLASMALLNSFVADGVGWTFDLIVALVSGRHPFGATAYMFDAQIPISIRILSLFHIAVPALQVWMVFKLRYHRRALVLQTVFAWSVLSFCLAFAEPALNLNCVWGPGTHRQTMVPAWLYFVILLAYVPLGFYLPIHLVLTRILKWDRPRVLKVTALA